MINEFQEIVSSYDIPEKVMQKIEDDISGKGKRKVSLTALQKEAITNPNFWGQSEGNKNLIVQGATSSGKTLVAELLALQYVFSLNKHVVYLVPLKALVSEKVQQFRRDIAEVDDKIKVNIFASSSDYQDHDTELAEGQYDIAVVVYEKFFAMLAEQKDNKFLEKCGLIIVDEVQLLGSQDRGAKLEYSLTKVKNMYGNNVRILGLTTVDCDTNYVNSWLDAVTIKNAQRPIGLKERIISLNGLYWERQVNGENADPAILSDEHREGQIEVEDVEKLKNQKVDVKRNALLISLLKNIYEEDSNKKIIVFANSRDRCKVVARNIAKGNVFGRLEVNSALSNELEKADDESERTLLENELLPYGIAYHSAALPMSLREVIEQEFKDNEGGIRLLVATETITIGMNLPADVMILYDNKVFRGSDGAVDLKPQEYKNYIGRAGRLGITDKIGESYLFVNSDSDIRYYWNQYVNCRIEEVSSALVNATPRESAPYFLNLLCKGKEETFSEGTIEVLARKTLNASEANQKGRIYSIDTDKIVRDFEKVELVRTRDIIADELDDEENSVGYKLTPLGEMLAPYALSIETCLRIKKYFRDDGDIKKEMGGLPLDFSSTDLRNDKYLLDILFLVCKMPEVRKITHPRLPDRSAGPYQRKVSQVIQKAILDYFAKVLKENGEEAFWKNSEIRNTFFDCDILDDDQLTPALRAILLYHWIKGELPREIRKNAGLDNKEFVLYTGDLARIGESCSYVIEAISRCLGTNPKRVNQTDCGALEHAFYSLAERLKYGLSNHSLIQVANRHVYGLSRNSIIRMDVVAKENEYENINLFIRSANPRVYEFLTASQREELMRLMSERYEDKNVENLINKIIADEIVDYSLESDLKTIAHPRDKDEWIGSLREVFTQLKVTTPKVTVPGCLRKLQWNNRTMHIVALFGKGVDVRRTYEVYREKLTVSSDDKIVFVYNKDVLPTSECDNDIVISSDYFCKVILEFLAMSDSANGALICDYLYNQTGSISDKGIGHLQKQINYVLSGQLSIEEEQAEELAMSSYERYIKDFNYIDLDDGFSPSGAHAMMHRVKGKRDNAIYIIKEINIPEDIDEFDCLNEKAENIYYQYYTQNDNPNIREIIQREWPGVSISDEDYEEAIKICYERKKQLSDNVEKKDLYFIQSLTFYMEGYKRLSEARIVAGLRGAEQNHIVVGANPEIYHTDYNSPKLRNVDTQFNHLRTDFFFAMTEMDGTIHDKRNELIHNKSEVLLIAQQISDALIRCHAEGILHRDIKPNNILYINRNKYCLCDFGCATRSDLGKTIGVGTKGYMAPESINGVYTERSDLYSLAKTLIYCYVGNSVDTVRDDDLFKVFTKAANENPDERYKDVQEFLEALSKIKI